MKIEIGEDSVVILKEVYNSIVLLSNAKEKISVCMRDSGFEFVYEGKCYTAQNGSIKKVKKGH